MSPIADRIEKVVLKAMASANQTRGDDDQLACSPTATLYGPGSPLDSLGLVNILIDIEDELRSCGMEVSLSDERAMSQTRSPFRSVPTLVAYIQGLIEPSACQS